MKTPKLLLLAPMVWILASNIADAQTLNWSSLKPEQRHIATANVGYDYSFSYGIGYGYQLKSKLPTVLNLEFSQPAGDQVMDDFKTKFGGMVRVYRSNHIQFIVKVQGVFRRFHNDFVRMLNFGSDMSGVIGYYRKGWFASGEFGFDKAIVTQFKHTELYRSDFPEVKDGWYKPATGGNFYFGLQTGVSIGNNDITLKLGRVVEQDFKTNPTVPFYVQVGYNRRF